MFYLYKILNSLLRAWDTSNVMRQNFKPYISLKCSGFFCNIEHISRSNNGVLSPALLKDVDNYSSYEGIDFQLFLSGIPTGDIYLILHDLLSQELKNNKHNSDFSFFYKRHNFYLFPFHKIFQLATKLRGNALSLIQSQYTKKKRNPE